MNKILITNPPGRFIRGAGDRWPTIRAKENPTPIRYSPFPFLIGYTAAVLEKEGYNVAVKDFAEEDLSREDFCSYIQEYKPDLIVFQTSTPSYYYDVETLRMIKNKTDAPVVAIGFHATAVPERHLVDGFDYVIRGEYEYPTLELVRALEKNKKTNEIKGVAFKDNDGNPKNNGFADPVKNLDSLPLPARHLMAMDRYCEPFAKGKNIWMMATRGCAHNCLYCTLPVFSGKPSFRIRNPKNIVEEMEHVINQYNPDEIYFDDASISTNKKHILALCDEIIKRNLNIRWSCMVDPYISDEIIEAMAKAGCVGIKIGIETGDIDIAEASSRQGSSLESAKRAINKCKQKGIKTLGTYMFGMPGETKEKAQKTIDFMTSLKIDTAQIFICPPFPGTGLYNLAKEKDWLISNDWRLFDGFHVLLEYPDYSRLEIEKMYKLACNKWNRHIAFRRPGTVIHHLYGIFRRKGFLAAMDAFKWGLRTVIKGV